MRAFATSSVNAVMLVQRWVTPGAVGLVIAISGISSLPSAVLTTPATLPLRMQCAHGYSGCIGVSAIGCQAASRSDREAAWQPIADTPMHPEYPCAHCILSGSVAGVVKTALGSEEIPEIAMTSPTAPGVTHRWTNMTALTEEVANARIWSGFHYRFSTRVGTQMGLQIGEYVVKTIMQPAVTAGPQQLPPQGLVPVAR